MGAMELIPCSAAAPSGSTDARGQCGERTRRLVRVKFVSLPMESPPPARRSLLMDFITRVIRRLVAARP
jgi:hypothetical protein